MLVPAIETSCAAKSARNSRDENASRYPSREGASPFIAGVSPLSSLLSGRASAALAHARSVVVACRSPTLPTPRAGSSALLEEPSCPECARSSTSVPREGSGARSARRALLIEGAETWRLQRRRLPRSGRARLDSHVLLVRELNLLMHALEARRADPVRTRPGQVEAGRDRRDRGGKRSRHRRTCLPRLGSSSLGEACRRRAITGASRSICVNPPMSAARNRHRSQRSRCRSSPSRSSPPSSPSRSSEIH